MEGVAIGVRPVCQLLNGKIFGEAGPKANEGWVLERRGQLLELP